MLPSDKNCRAHKRGPELSSFNILLGIALYLFLCSSEAGPVMHLCLEAGDVIT